MSKSYNAADKRILLFSHAAKAEIRKCSKTSFSHKSLNRKLKLSNKMVHYKYSLLTVSFKLLQTSSHVVDMGKVALCQRSLDFLFVEDITVQLMKPLDMYTVLKQKNRGLWQPQKP
jgi:hypothetical protein